MSLLFLTGLGTANLKAQVRIGGDGAPNAAAVLDLNVDDATTGTRGLALPRVSLANNKAYLNGTKPLNGTLVYNTNPGLGSGVFYWVDTIWVKSSAEPLHAPDVTLSAVPWISSPATVTWYKVLQTTITLPKSDAPLDMHLPVTPWTDAEMERIFCRLDGTPLVVVAWQASSKSLQWNWHGRYAITTGLRCYRASV